MVTFVADEDLEEREGIAEEVASTVEDSKVEAIREVEDEAVGAEMNTERDVKADVKISLGFMFSVFKQSSFCNGSHVVTSNRTSR